MEVEQEVNAVPPAEGSPGAKTVQSTADRLRQITEERQQWIAKRRERLTRKNRLLKLLELGAAKKLNQEAKGSENKAENEAENTKKNANVAIENAESQTATVAARKKELKELQERANIAEEKQKQVASALARNLKQLNAKNEAQLETTQRPPMKRKREGDTATEQPGKKVAVMAAAGHTVSTPEMPPFVTAPDLDVGTSELAAAVCFRIATRHLTLTGTIISKRKLDEAFKVYTNKVLDEAVDERVLDRSLLNGVCNDNNCSFYHKKDYEAAVDEVSKTIGGAAVIGNDGL
ncbi:hypothetical protein BBO99_00001542 [Phytophthora kernoviae]|uniref:Uncharacterized protein n=2 Tax=Phytophthora kernoviae TaxID=325452 RepID=A0A3R7KNA4_9STRA|nr:hypothetical protein G195_003739 [Phytophthora kernoviae 00238/432]KAG2530114.1 hypothetical protein JM18_002414 [Phytophthora kernoviae]KAG2531394.1 hypothetical protein JM16_001076 [Phytophthora kernoviae]RLN20299.1 hypothetical protein BBI17_001365 [Phytophthora kernoviae]RLN84174.1 hypothetical protein BBO99_00001542 [Phytophthora kernoviae]